jgi:hypothetical protein
MECHARYMVFLAARLRSLRSFFSLIVSLGLLVADFFFCFLYAIATPPASSIRVHSGQADSLADLMLVRQRSIWIIVEDWRRNRQIGRKMTLPMLWTIAPAVQGKSHCGALST